MKMNVGAGFSRPEASSSVYQGREDPAPTTSTEVTIPNNSLYPKQYNEYAVGDY